MSELPHKDEVLREQSWEAYRATGLSWFVNRILHVFGWAIVVEIDDTTGAVRGYPARTVWRGFDPETEARGFRKVTEYMQANADELRKELGE